MRGVTIGDKHSYNDFGLYLKSYPAIEPPEPKTMTVDVPGSDGKIDLTECLTGDVYYETRKISMTFLVIDARNRWLEVYSKLLEHCHGKRMRIVFDDDIGYFYLGRMFVEKMDAKKRTSTITISAEVEPYKYEVNSSIDDWEWDVFDFENSVIRELNGIDISGSRDVVVVGSNKPAILKLTSSSAMTVSFAGNQYEVKEGSNSIHFIVIREGENRLHFVGNGTISIDFRGGRL